MTVCNMSIEMGARGGMIAPDETTFEYIKGRRNAPTGEQWEKAVAYWKTLPTDADAKFDLELTYEAADIEPQITYGTNPGMGTGITQNIPSLDTIEEASKKTYLQSMKYMGFEPGDKLEGKKVDYVFLGSCTNGRIEDLRVFAEAVKGKKKADNITAWIVPGSRLVEKQAIEEGIKETVITSYSIHYTKLYEVSGGVCQNQ